MPRQPETVETSFYVVLEPKWSTWYKDADGEPVLDSVRAARMTKSRPTNTHGLVAKIKVRTPGRAFMPLRPVVTIDIPGDLLAMDEVEAEAEDANADA